VCILTGVSRRDVGFLVIERVPQGGEWRVNCKRLKLCFRGLSEGICMIKQKDDVPALRSEVVQKFIT
jgi:hypothetical protein